MNSIRSDCEDAIANNFLGVGVEVAGYALTCISGKDSGLVAEWKREVYGF